MSENSTGDIPGSSGRERSRKLGKVLLRILQALNREAKVIEALPHAHVGMVACPPYNQIYRTVGYAEGIFITKIFAFLEFKNLMIKFGDLLGLQSSDGDVVDLPWLLPAVFLVTFLNFWMFFPRDVELRSSRVMTPEYGECHLLQSFGDQGLRVFLLHFF